MPMTTVPAKAVRASDGNWDLVVRSVTRHTVHGGGNGEKPDLYGERQSHCAGIDTDIKPLYNFQQIE